MKLHGAIHSVESPLAGMDIAVLPSGDLLLEIRDLPEGSIVAVEATPEMIYANDRENGFHLPANRIAYWKSIIRFCEHLGHKVAYVDDYEQSRQVNNNEIKMKSMQAEFQNVYEQLSPGEKRLVTEKFFALQAISDYIYVIEREKNIYKNIISANPAMAIIGQAHSDYLKISDYNEKIYVDEYTRGEVPSSISMMFGFEDEPIQEQCILDNPSDSLVLAEQGHKLREAKIRRYNAFTSGRIIPEKDAAWIGSWDSGCRHNGLFELYPAHISEDGQETTGTIEDIIGTATFTGCFSGDDFWFVKKYIPELTLYSNFIKEEILYEIDMTSSTDEYVGQWSSGNKSGKFILKKGSSLFLPEELYQSE